MAGSDHDKAISSTAPKRWPLVLIVAACLYAGWFAWLAYVAWVNVRAGNQ